MDYVIKFAEYLVATLIGGGLFTFIVELRKAKTTENVELRKVKTTENVSEADAAERIANTAAKMVETMVNPLSARISQQEAELGRMRLRLSQQDEKLDTTMTMNRRLVSELNKLRTGVILLNQQVLEISGGKIQPIFIIEKGENGLHFNSSQWEVSGSYPFGGNDPQDERGNVPNNAGSTGSKGQSSYPNRGGKPRTSSKT